MFKQLTHRGLALILTAILTLALVPMTAFAAQTWTKTPQVTVNVPGTKDLQITFTNVASLYTDTGYSIRDLAAGEGKGTTAWRGITFYLYDDSTVSFNKTVEMQFGTNPDPKTVVKVINVGETLSASDLSGDNYLELGQDKNLALVDTASAGNFKFNNGHDFFNVTFYPISWLAQDWVNKDGIQLSKIIAEPPQITATPTNTAFMLGGKEVALPAYTIDNSNYVKLRDVAALLKTRFDVRFQDGKAKLYNHENYTSAGGELAAIGAESKTAEPSKTDFVWGDSGEPVSGLTAYLIGGSNYIKLRDIAKLFDFNVDWRDGKAWIEPDVSYTED